MPNDPGLTADTCFFMEAIPGDGGAHDSTATWWLSPDIKLTGPNSGLDNADAGKNNSVEVRFHRKGAGSGCASPFAESITVELWVGNPSLAMTPDNRVSTKNVQNIGSTVPAEGTTGTQVIVWHAPAVVHHGDPQSPGPKCLIARCYPDPVTPSSTDFFVPDDPHVAQHNICVVRCERSAASTRICSVGVSTVNPDRQAAQSVRLRAALDLNPGHFVQAVVLRRLKSIRGFSRLANRPPLSFSLTLPDFPNAVVTDLSRPGALELLFGLSRRPRSYEAQFQMAAGQFTNFTFNADLSRTGVGEAIVFHLRQVGADDRDLGGLTIVMLAV